jgi:hypothetical protein
MYKQNNTKRLESLNSLLLGKRKLMLLITAFMIGMSNGMNIGDEFALKKATSYGTTGQKRLILYFINSLQNNPISFFPS